VSEDRRPQAIAGHRDGRGDVAREQDMAEQIPLTRRMRICTLPGLTNVFLVLVDGSEPGSVPVIPTPLAEGYWALHPRVDAPALIAPCN
jgi:hypothetical protein